MMLEPLPRLESVLRQLPVVDTPRVLSVGCGTYPCAFTLRHVHPAWALYGVDIDMRALRQAREADRGLRLVQADMRDLPGLLRTSFGLILVRHPDLFRHPQAWETVIPRLLSMLAPDGWLVVTVYSSHESAILDDLALPPPQPLNDRALAVVDIIGRDRYIHLYHANSTG